jgi:hypothetical protein
MTLVEIYVRNLPGNMLEFVSSDLEFMSVLASFLVSLEINVAFYLPPKEHNYPHKYAIQCHDSCLDAVGKKFNLFENFRNN